MPELETKLYRLINELYHEIKGMTPEGGFSSPRDLELVREVNKKAANKYFTEENYIRVVLKPEKSDTE